MDVDERDVTDEIRDLFDRYQQGHIGPDEFAAAKARLLESAARDSTPRADAAAPAVVMRSAAVAPALARIRPALPVAAFGATLYATGELLAVALNRGVAFILVALGAAGAALLADAKQHRP